MRLDARGVEGKMCALDVRMLERRVKSAAQALAHFARNLTRLRCVLPSFAPRLLGTVQACSPATLFSLYTPVSFLMTQRLSNNQTSAQSASCRACRVLMLAARHPLKKQEAFEAKPLLWMTIAECTATSPGILLQGLQCCTSGKLTSRHMQQFSWHTHPSRRRRIA